MSMKTKFKRFFELEDDQYEYEDETTQSEQKVMEEEYLPRKQEKKSDKNNVVSLQSVQKSAKMMLIEPRTYDEVQDIADHLKNRKAVVINLQRISHDQAKRIVDFLSGTVYAIGGDIQKLGANIFLCTPDNVDVTGTISEIISE
ncbi:cell division protein SepF [Anaerobacillus alkalidiazotrophicus]|uniref:Cell division protein SepF n=1 Tax=Anaerobacillus alkalidiazotrophicus TaxID=472963 RepID=A0A1S2LZH5_9BACI|nr:cell division protein SepF [Anaerobacillus alkalidiazotrophicus]OIJ17756.1 cell division protein SepF [Anaerobacillus alkalidiazotrophicus]